MKLSPLASYVLLYRDLFENIPSFHLLSNIFIFMVISLNITGIYIFNFSLYTDFEFWANFWRQNALSAYTRIGLYLEILFYHVVLNIIILNIFYHVKLLTGGYILINCTQKHLWLVFQWQPIFFPLLFWYLFFSINIRL